jgi:hypothetical protein
MELGLELSNLQTSPSGDPALESYQHFGDISVAFIVSSMTPCF